MTTNEQSETPRTLRCFRDGKWQVDELANTAAQLERELAEAKEEIESLKSEVHRWRHSLD